MATTKIVATKLVMPLRARVGIFCHGSKTAGALFGFQTDLRLLAVQRFHALRLAGTIQPDLLNAVFGSIQKGFTVFLQGFAAFVNGNGFVQCHVRRAPAAQQCFPVPQRPSRNSSHSRLGSVRCRSSSTLHQSANMETGGFRQPFKIIAAFQQADEAVTGISTGNLHQSAGGQSKSSPTRLICASGSGGGHRARRRSARNPVGNYGARQHARGKSLAKMVPRCMWFQRCVDDVVMCARFAKFTGPRVKAASGGWSRTAHLDRPENILRAIAVVHVPINDRHPLYTIGFLAWRAAIATLLNRQKPMALDFSAWCPVGARRRTRCLPCR